MLWFSIAGAVAEHSARQDLQCSQDPGTDCWGCWAWNSHGATHWLRHGFPDFWLDRYANQSHPNALQLQQ